jgi:Flp pilus assembly CpaE family ATPase
MSAAMQSKVKNKIKTVSGAMNVPSVKKTKETFDALKETFSGKEKQLEEYFSRVDMAEGATLPKNLLESLEMSSGIKTFIVPKK